MGPPSLLVVTHAMADDAPACGFQSGEPGISTNPLAPSSETPNSPGDETLGRATHECAVIALGTRVLGGSAKVQWPIKAA